MLRRGSRFHPCVVYKACGLAIVLCSLGCSSEPQSPAAQGALPVEVTCDSCGKKVARTDTESHISLEGLDVYVCRACAGKAAKGRPASPPPGRASAKSSNRGTS
jgi:hypothetical protein